MKAIVDVASNTIIGVYKEPIKFPVSGFYVIDVPNKYGIDIINSSPSTLITNKTSSVKSASTLANINSDEFLNISKIDPALSSRIVCGPNKKVTIQKNGILMTTSFLMTGTITKAFIHYYVHRLFRDTYTSSVSSPPPSKMLYGYDGSNFSEFDHSLIQVDIMNSIGTISQVVLTLDTLVNYSASSPTVRLRFTNNSNDAINLSNWYLCW